MRRGICHIVFALLVILACVVGALVYLVRAPLPAEDGSFEVTGLGAVGSRLNSTAWEYRTLLLEVTPTRSMPLDSSPQETGCSKWICSGAGQLGA